MPIKEQSMDGINQVFGRRLRAIRKSKGLTQEQLGKAAGIDYKHLGGIERGEHAPSFDAIEKLVKVLGVPYHGLFAPEKAISGQLEDALDLLVRDVDQMDRATFKRFFADLLAAVRRARG